MKILISCLYISIILFSNYVNATGKFHDYAEARNKGEHELAFELLKPIAEDGNPQAQYLLGFTYQFDQIVPHDVQKAIYWYTKAAEQGHIEAQSALGGIYFTNDFERDYSQAAEWYRKAAKQGDKHSQAMLASMYREGQGVPQDYIESILLYKKSAAQGYSYVFSNIADMYFKGQGVVKNYTLAHMWANLAVANGDNAAIEIRDDAAKKLTDTQILKAQRLAKNCVRLNYKNCG